jgi:hypothetical protein
MRREMLGAEGPKSMRESGNTQPLEVRFRAALGEEPEVELKLL